MEGGGNKQNRHLLRALASACCPPAGAPGNVRIIQDLLGYGDVKTAIIYAMNQILARLNAAIGLYNLEG
jgi:hypothetical protein